MTREDPYGTAGPLTVGHLVRELTARAGQPAPALRVYESLAALWIRCCDTGRPGAGQLRGGAWRAARLLVAGEDTVIAPQQRSIPGHLARDESLVRVPASWAVQGVEWPDAVALAEAWLLNRVWDGPVLVAGVRTGGAYLAPLVAARLEAEGIDAQVAGIRPGEEQHGSERRVLLVDDPPLTGRTLLSLAREVPGPGGAEVLVPVFDDGDVRALREEGITLTVLPRERWHSTRRLEPEALAAYLRAHAAWPGTDRPPAVDGLLPGRENSVLRPWPGVRRRSPARAALRLRTPDGVWRAVAGWVSPGVFGDAARTAAAARHPVVPATLAVAPALVLTEDLTPLTAAGPPGRDRLDEAVDYVLARARQLPLPAVSGRPIPAVLRTVAKALTGADDEAAPVHLHRLLSSLAPALPDNRCEAEKWFLDEAGHLRKTGHLTHTYRRDNELLTPLIDLAALTTAFGCGLRPVAASLARHLPGADGPWQPALAAALLCYGSARGAQIPRTYNPQRAAVTAVETYRLQHGMSRAAHLVRHHLTGTSPGHAPGTEAGEEAAPRIVHQWQRAPGALVQPRLPFGGNPATHSNTVLTVQERETAQKTIAQWAGPMFLPVAEDNLLLLAPLQSPRAWPQAGRALEELARILPRPGLLAWCGVPCVNLMEAV
ncbi:hypothetical protein ACFWGI_35480 [Streptomyces niveus]|uniref:hypothetical protein n=1 Tax=Streptomyces niveus TaxID=193462 RepID=UPI00364E4DB3